MPKLIVCACLGCSHGSGKCEKRFSFNIKAPKVLCDECEFAAQPMPAGWRAHRIRGCITPTIGPHVNVPMMPQSYTAKVLGWPGPCIHKRADDLQIRQGKYGEPMWVGEEKDYDEQGHLTPECILRSKQQADLSTSIQFDPFPKQSKSK